jgi:multidrug efflux pump subunit AcrB
MHGRNAIRLLVKAGEDADRLSTAYRVKDYIEERNTRLPADVRLLLIKDDTVATTAMLDVLISNAIAGIILVVLVLLCFFSFRLTIWVALGIPTAIMMVFAVMPLLGLSVNLFTMAALILMLGIMVDDAVVVAESIFRHHEYDYTPVESAVIGTNKVVLPVVTSALTTMVALAPAAFIGGVQGKAFYVIPIMAILVLLMSLLECKFILPSHIAHSLQGAGHGKLTRSWFQAVEDGYESLMMKVIPHRYIFAVLTLVLFVVAAVLASSRLVFVSAPETNADILYIKAEGAIGTSLTTMENKLAGLERELRGIIPGSELDEIVVTAGHHDHDRGTVTEGRDPAWGLVSIFLQPAGGLSQLERAAGGAIAAHGVTAGGGGDRQYAQPFRGRRPADGIRAQPARGAGSLERLRARQTHHLIENRPQRPGASWADRGGGVLRGKSSLQRQGGGYLRHRGRGDHLPHAAGRGGRARSRLPVFPGGDQQAR